MFSKTKPDQGFLYFIEFLPLVTFEIFYVMLGEMSKSEKKIHWLQPSLFSSQLQYTLIVELCGILECSNI